MLEKFQAERNIRILGFTISVLLIISSLGFVGNIFYEVYSLLKYTDVLVSIIYSIVDIVSQGMLLTAFALLAVTILNKNKLNIDIVKIFAELFLIASILYLTNGLYQLVIVFGADILSILGAVFGKPLFYLFAVSKIAIATAILVFNKRNKLVSENKSAKIILSILFAVSFCLYCVFEIGVSGLTASFVSFFSFLDKSVSFNNEFSNTIFISFFVHIIFLLAEYIPLFLFFVIYPKEYLDKKAVSPYSDNAKSEIINKM